MKRTEALAVKSSTLLFSPPCVLCNDSYSLNHEKFRVRSHPSACIRIGLHQLFVNPTLSLWFILPKSLVITS